jgi:hypothetical protein
VPWSTSSQHAESNICFHGLFISWLQITGYHQLTRTKATVTQAAARRARDVVYPADAPEQPLQTTPLAPNEDIRQQGKTLKTDAPLITPKPGSVQAYYDGLHEKRQNLVLTTVTQTVRVVTIPSTSNRVFTVTASARATVTASTTIWQTVTSVINARRTVIATTTFTFVPNAPTTVLVTQNAAPTTGNPPAGSGSGSGSDPRPSDADASPNPPSATGSSSLSKGAQAGIGAGTGAGSLIIVLFLGFCFHRRRKSRKEREKEMIQSTVTSTMAAQQQQNQEQQLRSIPSPPNQYITQDHDKHLSSTTVSGFSPQQGSYSPSPPLHAPQPGYVYPPPPNQYPQPAYNTNPMSFPEAMGPHTSMAPHYGTEMEGSPTVRYELPLYGSPQPRHPGPYSNLPEARP